MKKPNITKGQWNLSSNFSEPHSCNDIISTGGEFDAVICRLTGLGVEQTGANAKAISAVPEMIDALIEFYGAWKNVDDPEHEGYAIIQKAKQALLKAGVEL